MSDLPIPPHIKKARAALPVLAIPAEALPHVEAVLQLVTDAYHGTTQVSRTDKMKRQRDQTQDELESVSSDLLAARKQIVELKARLLDQEALRAQLMKEAQSQADKRMGQFMSAATNLRELFFIVATVLNGKGTDADGKVEAAKSLLGRALAASTNRKHKNLGNWLVTNEIPAPTPAPPVK